LGVAPAPTASVLPPASAPADPQAPAPGVPPAAGAELEVGAWPAGRAAWTVVLASTDDDASARRRARELVAGGTAAGVLDSDRYPSLRPGFAVVFSGEYPTRSAAERAAQDLRAQVPDAYPRRISPR